MKVGVEFGHIKVVDEGAPCRCGQRGCLEAYVADYALVRAAAETIDNFEAETKGRGMRDVDAVVRLAALAEGGDAAAVAIYQRAGRMLGLGLANLVNLFDPSLIIVAGERMAHQHLMAETIETTLHRNRLAADRPPVRLLPHRWGDELWARGAGALAIEGVIGAL